MAQHIVFGGTTQPLWVLSFKLAQSKPIYCNYCAELITPGFRFNYSVVDHVNDIVVRYHVPCFMKQKKYVKCPDHSDNCYNEVIMCKSANKRQN